ncbi:MAG: heme biosynthesis HemY N-terminal domain-containing protein [Porticoccaceae bacterium]
MRKALLVFAAMLLAGGLIFWGLDYARGYILIVIGDRMVQLSLWLTALLLVVIVLGWYGLKLLWRGLTQPGLNAWRGQRSRREERNRRAVMVALADFYEGHWARARSALVESAPRSEIPGLNYVLAADAATRLGQDQEAVELLAAAAREVPEDNAALALMRARLAARAGDEIRAVAQLRAALAVHVDHPGLLAELRDGLLRQQDWDGLAGLLPGLRRARVASPEELAALELQIYAGLLNGFSVDTDGESPQQRRAALTELWQRIPHEYQRRSECLRSYARALARLGEPAAAELELRRHLDRNWEPDLVLDWSRVALAEPPRHLAAAEGWLRRQGESWQLLLALGQLCRRLGIWGKGRDYLERALRVADRPEIQAELAEVLTGLGDHAGAAGCYRRGLQGCLAQVQQYPTRP